MPEGLIAGPARRRIHLLIVTKVILIRHAAGTRYGVSLTTAGVSTECEPFAEFSINSGAHDKRWHSWGHDTRNEEALIRGHINTSVGSSKAKGDNEGHYNTALPQPHGVCRCSYLQVLATSLTICARKEAPCAHVCERLAVSAKKRLSYHTRVCTFYLQRDRTHIFGRAEEHVPMETKDDVDSIR